MMPFKFKIYRINTPAGKIALLNYRVCMGTQIQRMYGYVHIASHNNSLALSSFDYNYQNSFCFFFVFLYYLNFEFLVEFKE